MCELWWQTGRGRTQAGVTSRDSREGQTWLRSKLRTYCNSNHFWERGWNGDDGGGGDDGVGDDSGVEDCDGGGGDNDGDVAVVPASCSALYPHLILISSLCVKYYHYHPLLQIWRLRLGEEQPTFAESHRSHLGDLTAGPGLYPYSSPHYKSESQTLFSPMGHTLLEITEDPSGPLLMWVISINICHIWN